MRNLSRKQESRDANHFTQETGFRSAIKGVFKEINISNLGKEELSSAKTQHSTLKRPRPGSGAFWEADDGNPAAWFFILARLFAPSLVTVAGDAGGGIPCEVQ